MAHKKNTIRLPLDLLSISVTHINEVHATRIYASITTTQTGTVCNLRSVFIHLDWVRWWTPAYDYARRLWGPIHTDKQGSSTPRIRIYSRRSRLRNRPSKLGGRSHGGSSHCRQNLSNALLRTDKRQTRGSNRPSVSVLETNPKGRNHFSIKKYDRRDNALSRPAHNGQLCVRHNKTYV